MEKYKYLLAPVMGYVVAQVIKFVLLLRKDGFQWGDLLQSGGFPSAHISFMAALSTLIGLEQGASSVCFAVAASLTAIIIYDSIGVRRTTGEQTEVIKLLAKNSRDKLYNKIHDSKGHTVLEASAGLVVGVIIGMVIHTI
jgi:acid phosphatase family membrane protein YuiD